MCYNSMWVIKGYYCQANFTLSRADWMVHIYWVTLQYSFSLLLSVWSPVLQFAPYLDLQIIFFTIFPVPSWLLYPSALWVSMLTHTHNSHEIAIDYLCFTNEEVGHRKIRIPCVQCEMPLVFIGLFKCRVLPFTSLSIYFFRPYSNLSSWVDKSKIPQSEIIPENNLPENLMVRAGKECYWSQQYLSAFTMKVISSTCNPLPCAPTSFRSLRQTIKQGSLRQLSPSLHNLDSGPE